VRLAGYGPNGANQIREMADPRTKAGFPIILAMDGYHNIKKNVQYPPVILRVGLNDKRVPPWETAKFGARLQASDTRQPVLVRVEVNAGHGIGSTSDQHANERADMMAFFLERFGHEDFKPVTTK